MEHCTPGIVREPKNTERFEGPQQRSVPNHMLVQFVRERWPMQRAEPSPSGMGARGVGGEDCSVDLRCSELMTLVRNNSHWPIASP